METQCTLSDAELIERSKEWVNRLAKTGGEAWVLRVPVDFNYDPDMLFLELCKRVESQRQLIGELAAYMTGLKYKSTVKMPGAIWTEIEKLTAKAESFLNQQEAD